MVHKTETTITTAETSTGQFEAFVTMQNKTHKYNDVPYKNEASVKAAAIYYSLKQMTNILGYQIIDLNYPILSQLVTATNDLTIHIGLLQ
jgi:tryptophanyl-tRNA synthetase